MILADGPLGYWKLNDTSGTTAVDSSPTPKSGTYQGSVTAVTGGPIDTTESVRSFVGTNTTPNCDGINVPATSFLVSGDYSIEMWINTAAADDRALFRLRLYGYNFALAGGKLKFQTTAGSAEKYTATGVRLVNDSKWHHVTAARKIEGANVRMNLYVDGALDSSTVFTPSATSIYYGPYTPKVGIGRDGDVCPSLSAAPHLGRMAHVAFYSRALTGGEVLRHASLGPIGAPITAAEAQAGGSPSQQCVCHGNTADVEPVNGLTGEMYHSFVDFSIAGRGVPLRFARTYSSSAAATNGVLGGR